MFTIAIHCLVTNKTTTKQAASRREAMKLVKLYISDTNYEVSFDGFMYCMEDGIITRYRSTEALNNDVKGESVRIPRCVVSCRIFELAGCVEASVQYGKRIYHAEADCLFNALVDIYRRIEQSGLPIPLELAEAIIRNKGIKPVPKPISC